MVRALPLARDLGLAGALAGLMTLGWWAARAGELARGQLPDADDAARLQQIRDWLGGQAFADVSQHRFGLDGLAMHWSRLADLVPAAMLRLGIGEAAMLVLWPALLFALYLALSARLARAVGARPVDALLLAALAYPATAMFAPGRIDHHGLQTVLLAAFALGLTIPRAAAGGALAGTAAALSLAIGMETAPILALGAAVAVLRWLAGEAPARLAAIGAALLLGAAAMAGLFAPADWPSAPCDGFARASWRAASIGGGALLALGIGGLSASPLRRRIALASIFGVAALAALLLAAPACLSPYGAVDPLLARLWLHEVGEAQPILAADPRWAIGYAGVGVVALAAALWTAGGAPALTLAALVAGGLAVSLLQLRGAYAAAALAPPLVALALARARAAHPLAALPWWFAGAGIAWPLAASALPVRDPLVPAGACDDAVQAAAMRALPPGRVLGPVDFGPWLVAGTRHHAIAAPYHRNAQGILAAYRLFAADPRGGETVAMAARANYVVACPAAVAAMRSPPTGLGVALAAGRVPGWLAPTDVRWVWRVRSGAERLPPPPPNR